MICVSFLAVGASLAASPTAPAETAATPVPASVPTPAGPAAAEPVRDPIVATTVPAPAPPSSTQELITPEALQQLVALRAAHPRPMRPAVECIARTVYHEAANQALRGQLAVAQVIVNRAKSGSFPKSVCAVVSQPGQFSQAPVTVARGTARPWDVAVAISTIAQEGRVAQVAPGALFFHADYVRPYWTQTHQRIAQIGDHIFYR